MHQAITLAHSVYGIMVHSVQAYQTKLGNNFESIPDAGAAISSEQSGEMLYSRIHKVWNLRFKTGSDRPIYPQRLVDCILTYNYNLQWDKATRSTTNIESSNNTEGESDEDRDNEERLVPPNWETDSESSDSE